MPTRREFIRHISSASLVMLGGSVLKLTPTQAAGFKKDIVLRFAVASDGHYGEKNTDYVSFFETMTGNVTKFHQQNPLDFCVINGDIIHDEKDFLVPAKAQLDKLPVKYYVTKGNHDKVSDDYWNAFWGIPVNHDVTIKESVLLLATTSNEKGEYLSPNLDWMKAKLEEHKQQKNIFVFIHIPQAKWAKFSLETPAFLEMMQQYKNIRGVFHGHEHEEDGVKMIGAVPCMFDSHFGGSWGTAYKGFRVVELMRDGSYLTYIMNPTKKINQASF
ncbi:3',5'-cyclic AMP phosphodiesterase CpdA [Chryseolinea serpens]|uniref:3',5'-cyclic AMP phosphodiesterase CpdA n=1 Tax=Chryseolinea serpens TaxID=947013 RepID=A0A1M5XN61_9BACT|nr:metallophosphoesterase [Chryseolinea serpens]SHI01231.1 3',5'-cyclic AMP phosphodiesterase CpdA [Chryseolinea serpens]